MLSRVFLMCVLFSAGALCLAAETNTPSTMNVVIMQSDDQNAQASEIVKSNVIPGELTALSLSLPLPISHGSSPKTLSETQKEDVKYWAFCPKNDEAKSEQGYPLLLFLHGSGERGDDLELLKRYGPPRMLCNAETAETWPFFLVAPQCARNHNWSALQLALLLDHVCKEFPIDTDRIYITGVSMGGFGVWEILATYPERIAAAAPVCGGGNLQKAREVTSTPIWAFHGEADPIVSCPKAIEMINAAKEAGNEDAKITTYPRVGHDCWHKAYAEKELYSWFLSKKLKHETE
ncbi:MAG: dienelactone hydrolase family protein [Planctomycetia bacterium]|nr:dienelactone hydrolase family protein [Planctomycetia bacterium]